MLQLDSVPFIYFSINKRKVHECVKKIIKGMCQMEKWIHTAAVLPWPRVLKSQQKLDFFPFLFFPSCYISHTLLEDCNTEMQQHRSQ